MSHFDLILDLDMSDEGQHNRGSTHVFQMIVGRLLIQHFHLHTLFLQSVDLVFHECFMSVSDLQEGVY